jgi:hypothetical protein
MKTIVCGFRGWALSCGLLCLVTTGCWGQLRGEAKIAVFEVAIVKAQHFYCSKGYELSRCKAETGRLQQLLRQYHAEDLGEWEWILVRSQDWKPLLLQMELDPTSPAITTFTERQSLFEEALFERDAIRGAELMQNFQVPLNRLLALAVSHELGHALCHDLNEDRADRNGERIRNNQQPTCEASHQRR